MYFNIEIINKCKTTKITNPSNINIQYNVADPELSYDLGIFSENVGTCGEFTYTYNFGDKIPPGIIQINENDKKVLVYTEDNKFSGNY